MNKKLLFSFLTVMGTMVSMKAQRNELGIRLGMSNLVGDVGNTNYILQKPLSMDRVSDWGVPFYGGLLYRFNFNPYQTVRKLNNNFLFIKEYGFMVILKINFCKYKTFLY